MDIHRNSLLDKYNGKLKINSIIQDVYKKIKGNKILSPYFKDKNLDIILKAVDGIKNKIIST